MKQTKDWSPLVEPRVLLIGDNPTLQWSDEIIDYTMFLDYYFRERPYDLGERSRYAQAKATFEMIEQISKGRYKPQDVYATDFSKELLERPPKGKKILLPTGDAATQVERLRGILRDNPSIEMVYAISSQVACLLAEVGFFEASDGFVAGAMARNKGAQNNPPFYQPINPDSFTQVCFKVFDVIGFQGVQVMPIVPLNDFPLQGANLQKYGAAFEAICSL